MSRALDPAVEVAIRDALADPTASYADVARVVGCDERQIRRYAIRWGLAHEPRTNLTDDQREKIHRMLRAGCWTRRQIATGTGCSIRTVSDVSASLGIDRTKQRLARFGRRDETPLPSPSPEVATPETDAECAVRSFTARRSYGTR